MHRYFLDRKAKAEEAQAGPALEHEEGEAETGLVLRGDPASQIAPMIHQVDYHNDNHHSAHLEAVPEAKSSVTPLATGSKANIDPKLDPMVEDNIAIDDGVSSDSSGSSTYAPGGRDVRHLDEENEDQDDIMQCNTEDVNTPEHSAQSLLSTIETGRVADAGNLGTMKLQDYSLLDGAEHDDPASPVEAKSTALQQPNKVSPHHGSAASMSQGQSNSPIPEQSADRNAISHASPSSRRTSLKNRYVRLSVTPDPPGHSPKHSLSHIKDVSAATAALISAKKKQMWSSSKEDTGQEQQAWNKPGTWFNDEVVNSIALFATSHMDNYLFLPSLVFQKDNKMANEQLATTAADPDFEKRFRGIMNTFVFSQVSTVVKQGPSQGLASHTEADADRLRQLSFTSIMAVIHAHSHWLSVLIDLRALSWTIIDSLPTMSHTTAARDWCKALAAALQSVGAGPNKDWSAWSQKAPLDCPQQPNADDCGVYTCVFMLRLAAGLSTSAPVHGPLWRCIIYAITRQTTLHCSLPSSFTLLAMPALGITKAKDTSLAVGEAAVGGEAAQNQTKTQQDMAQSANNFNAVQAFANSVKVYVKDLQTRAEDLKPWLEALTDASSLFNTLTERHLVEESRLSKQLEAIQGATMLRKEAFAQFKRLGWGWTADQETAWLSADKDLEAASWVLATRLASMQAGWDRVDGMRLESLVVEVGAAINSCYLTIQSVKTSAALALEEIMHL